MPRPPLVRYSGLVGSLMLAFAAYQGGARSPWRPTITPVTIFEGREGVLLPLAWLLGVTLLTAAWWVGRRVAPSARWAYLTAALWAIPLLPFLPLGSYDAYSYACQGWQQAAGLDPYAGGVNDLGCPWAEAVAPTWRTSPAPYGPVFLLLAAAAAKLGGSLAGTLAALRVIAVLGVLAIALCLPALARRAGVPPARAVWLTLACPLVPIHLVSGMHNEAVMIALFVAALAVAPGPADGDGRPAGWLWRAAVVGALVGLAAGVKATAVVVLPFAALMFGRRWIRAAGVAAGGAAAALALASLVSGRGLGWLTGLAGSGVSVQWTSLPTAVGMTLDLLGAGGRAVPVTRVIGMLVLAALLVALWWRARRGDALRHAGLALAATVVLAPVFHPWYALWPLPVLAATLRRDTRWLVAPLAVAAVLCLPDGYNLALAAKAQGAVVMTLLPVGYLVWKVRNETNRDSPRPRAAHGGDGLSRVET